MYAYKLLFLTAVCEKCGAIGVKHAFYTKERRFCSRACARSSEHTAPTADSTYSPSHSIETPTSVNSTSPNESKLMKNVSLIEKCTFKRIIQYFCKCRRSR